MDGATFSIMTWDGTRFTSPMPKEYSQERMALYAAATVGISKNMVPAGFNRNTLYYNPHDAFKRTTDSREFVECDYRGYLLMAIRVQVPPYRDRPGKEISLCVKLITERTDGYVVKLISRDMLHVGSGPTLPCLYYLLHKDGKGVSPFRTCKVPIGMEHVLLNCREYPAASISSPSTWTRCDIRKEESCVYCLSEIPDMLCACPGLHVALCRACHYKKEHFCPICNMEAVTFPVTRLLPG
jgi:hypothetical protein